MYYYQKTEPKETCKCFRFCVHWAGEATIRRSDLPDTDLPDTLAARVACTSISRGQTFVGGFAPTSNAKVLRLPVKQA